MPRYELNLRDYYRIIRRHIVVVVVIAIGLGGLTFLLSTGAPNYRATATVRITRSTDLAGLLLQTFYWSPEDNISTQTRLISSQQVLLKVAQMRGRGIPSGISFADATEHLDYRAILSNLAGRVRASQIGYSSLVEITATGPTPIEAMNLARDVAEAYQSYSEERADQRASDARIFIDERLEVVKDSLTQTQAALKELRQQGLPYTSTDLATIQTQIQRQQTLQDRLTSLEQQRDRLENGLAVVGSAGTSLDAGMDSPYSEQFIEYARLINDRQRLRQTYTDQSFEIRSLNQRIAELQGLLLVSIEQDIVLVRGQLRDVEAIINQFPEAEIQLAELTRAVELNTALVTQLETRRQEATILEAEQSGEVEIIDHPTHAFEDQRSNSTVKSIVALLLGLMVGVLLAFVLETMDTSIGTIEDVEEYLELPVLAVIPHLEVEKVADQLVKENPQLKGDPNLHLVARLITQYDPKSPAAEAYRTLRTNLTFATAGTAESAEGKNTFVFTSSSLQEGKSTTIVNLAITIAQAGHRVLMMGCNMRRPTIFKSFGLERETGMTDILTGQKEWRECVKDVTDMMVGPLTLQSLMSMPGLDNLSIITAGGIPPNPSELLNSDRFARVIEEASREYDYVLVDAPPILPVTDAAVVARKVDWAVLIYQVGKVPRNALRRAKAHLQNVGGHVLGIAMNDVKAEIGGYSPYSQYMVKYYGEEAKDTRSLFRRIRDGLATLFRRSGREGEAEPPAPASVDEQAWIDVDYINGKGTSVTEGERLKDLPYSRIAEEEEEEVDGDEEEEEGEAGTGAEPEDEGNPSGEADNESQGDFEEPADSLLSRIPVWAWVMLLVLVAVVVLLISGVFSPGTSNDTIAQVDTSPSAGVIAEPAAPEEPAPQPKMPSATASATPVWAIQVASFRTEEEALAFIDRLASAGDTHLSGAWTRSEESAMLGAWHRVYLGTFEQRADCQSLLDRIIASDQTPIAMVRSVLPPAP